MPIHITKNRITTDSHVHWVHGYTYTMYTITAGVTSHQ